LSSVSLVLVGAAPPPQGESHPRRRVDAHVYTQASLLSPPPPPPQLPASFVETYRIDAVDDRDRLAALLAEGVHSAAAVAAAKLDIGRPDAEVAAGPVVVATSPGSSFGKSLAILAS